ncbi:MAG: TIM barrel protein [Rubrivivax sp.]|nr:TIM barrel protein [Rubrivivax sp.]
MTRSTGNIDDFGIAAVTLAGPLEARLAGIRDAGFTRVMLDAGDVARHPGGVEGAARAVQASGLRVNGLQWLRDFEGLSGRQHAHKLEIAKALLQMAHAVGAPMLLVSSSSHRAAAQDLPAIARDLRKLAVLAVPLGLKVAYEGASGGHTVRDCFGAWDAVYRADMPNLGLAIDGLHTALGSISLEDLDFIEPQKIFVVRLADVLDAGGPTGDAAGAMTHGPVFPGEGAHSEQVAALVLRLAALGFRGDWSFEVVNDDHWQLPPPLVARRARTAAQWLGEDVLRRSVPLPGRMRLRPARKG